MLTDVAITCQIYIVRALVQQTARVTDAEHHIKLFKRIHIWIILLGIPGILQILGISGLQYSIDIYSTTQCFITVFSEYNAYQAL